MNGTSTPARPGSRLAPIWLKVACALYLAGNLPFIAAPVITSQPVDATRREGEAAGFAVQVTSPVPVTLQWVRDGDAIPGANGKTLTVGPLSAGNDGENYSVTVTSAEGETASVSALLTITPGIVLSLSANRRADLQLYRGWPLVVEVALFHPDAFTPDASPLKLAGASGAWVRTLQLEIRNGQDQPQSWPWHAAPFGNPVAQLTGTSGARMFWWLTPEETAQLPVGEFVLAATLDTTASSLADGWKGVVSGLPVHLRVAAEPPSLTPEQLEQKQLRRADYSLLLGDSKTARTSVDTLLSAMPDNIGALTYDVYLKEGAGLIAEALQAVDKALEQVELQSPEASEPPAELLHKLAALSGIAPPPVIKVEIANQMIKLEWQADVDPAYLLESSENLRDWAPVDAELHVENNRVTVILQPTGSGKFYRLSRKSP